MSRRMNRTVLAAIVLGAATLPVLAYDVAGMRDAMRSMFSSIRTLLELSQSIESLADPRNERAILAAAAELADQASIVSEHAPRDEVSFLAGSLDRFASWIGRSYEWGRHDTTQRLVSAHRALSLLRAKVEEGFLAQGQDIPQEVVRHLQMLSDMVEARG